MTSSLINLDLLVTLIIPEIHKFTAAMGNEMPADGLIMFIPGMTVGSDDQKLLFRDGLGGEEKAVRKQQQAVKREQKAGQYWRILIK